MNRALSTRSAKSSSGGGGGGSSGRRGFSLQSLRGSIQPEISRRLYRLIKSENYLISAHETAARERASIATQLSEWGEQTGDDAVSDITDKIAVVLAELAELEDAYARALDRSRAALKGIRDTERSVQPSRDGRGKLLNEIASSKMRSGAAGSEFLVLEQELVRAEAENLVAEAQLTNITRQKLREAYAAEFAATIERAEKQAILARHGQRLIALLDDVAIAPGDSRPPYLHARQARQVLTDAEDDMREWLPPPPIAAISPRSGGSTAGSAIGTEAGGSLASATSPTSPRSPRGPRKGRADEMMLSEDAPTLVAPAEKEHEKDRGSACASEAPAAPMAGS